MFNCLQNINVNCSQKLKCTEVFTYNVFEDIIYTFNYVL